MIRTQMVSNGLHTRLAAYRSRRLLVACRERQPTSEAEKHRRTARRKPLRGEIERDNIRHGETGRGQQHSGAAANEKRSEERFVEPVSARTDREPSRTISAKSTRAPEGEWEGRQGRCQTALQQSGVRSPRGCARREQG